MTLYPLVHRQPHIGNCRAQSPAFVSHPGIDSFRCAGLTFFLCGFNFLQHKGSFTAKISGLQLLLRRPWSLSLIEFKFPCVPSRRIPKHYQYKISSWSTSDVVFLPPARLLGFQLLCLTPLQSPEEQLVVVR